MRKVILLPARRVREESNVGVDTALHAALSSASAKV